MAQIVLDRLKEHFHTEILETGSQLGNEWARVRRDAWRAVYDLLATTMQDACAYT